MPAGPGPIGFAAFVGVKFVGYTVAGWYLNRTYASKSHGSLTIGAARTALGVGVGVSYGLAWMGLGRFIGSSPVGWLFYPLLIPIRIVEWGLLLKWFFEPRFLESPRSWKAAAGGTVWSFALDAIGLLTAWVVPGGFWVC